MGKHVCPICETVYAQRADVEVGRGGVSKIAEAWVCPACKYHFASLDELGELLRQVQGNAPDLWIGDPTPRSVAGEGLITEELTEAAAVTARIRPEGGLSGSVCRHGEVLR
jgi:rubredoxin